MRIFSKDKKGFTFIEVLFVAVISTMVIGGILSVWTYSYRVWTNEGLRADLRIDMIKALEIIKRDLRLSSLTYMSFYPAGAEPYTAIGMPIAGTDANGFFILDSQGKIKWDKTVIYHVYTDGNGKTTLRRTVYDSFLTSKNARYYQLEQVVTNGTGASGSITDMIFLKNVEIFELSSLFPIIDFYDVSDTAVRFGKVVFGWARLAPGTHTIRFEVTDKNVLSSGYGLGIDNIMIEPSGSAREAEYYASSFAPSGSLVASGGAYDRIYNSIWSNNNYIEFNAAKKRDYIEFTDYYDLWRESAFENSALNNIQGLEEEKRMALSVPEQDEAEAIIWSSYVEAGDSEQNGNDGVLPAAVPITLRTVVSQNNIGRRGDIIRVNFKSSSAAPLVIEKAYITKRNGASCNGFANQDPNGLTLEEYHRHEQLFFMDEAGNATESVTIPIDGNVWSVWTAFPLRTDSDYLVSLQVSNPVSLNCKYWIGAPGADRTYYVITGSTYITAGTPDWSTESWAASPNIYITADVDVADTSGKVESQIFDTTLDDPVYNQIKWSENLPAGTNIVLSERSSDNSDMAGEAEWESLVPSGVNPHSLAVGAGRYIQFLAELTSEPFWRTAQGAELDYKAYIKEQVDNYPVCDFPKNYTVPYITEVSVPWIDDVAIDWPGQERICTVTGYIAKKNNYGQAKVKIDGEELVKMLSIHVKVSQEIHGKSVSEENYIEIEPRNTGK